MTDLSAKTVCVVDNGLFVELAITLSKSFGRTLYTTNWISPFPRSAALRLGDGIPGITRIDSIWPVLDSIDLFVFPDIFDGPLQVYLRKLGKRVWGSGLGESLELRRAESKRWLRSLGLPVGPYAVLTGLKALRKHLREHEGQHVKISRTRGDMETFRSSTYRLIEPRLDELEHSLGPNKDYVEFISEDSIDPATEVGFDGFTVDGRYPARALFGVEAKDSGYVGTVVPYGSLPGPVKFVNAKMAPLFANLQYRGFWSSEIRIAKDDTPYLIDPCCRMASPPGELYQYLITNLAEIMWAGAAGEMVQPQWKHPWGAQLILKSPWAEQNWQAIDFPDQYRDNVKLHYLTMLDGRHYYVPQAIEMPEIGAVVAGGDTREQAIAAVEKIAATIEGYDLEYKVEALEDAAAGMAKLQRAA